MRAAVREAKGRLGPGNLEGEARKYAGPYPRAAKGECAGETGEGGAKTRSDHAELRGGRAAHRRPEGLEWRAHEAKRSAQSKAAKRLEARGHAQRASAAPEHRAAEGESGAKTRNTAQAKRRAVRRRGATMLN